MFVRKDAAIRVERSDLLITPALAARRRMARPCAFEAAGYSNIIYHPYAVAGAIVAPQPLAVGSAVESFNGVSIRVSMDSSITSLADSIVYGRVCRLPRDPARRRVPGRRVTSAFIKSRARLKPGLVLRKNNMTKLLRNLDCDP